MKIAFYKGLRSKHIVDKLICIATLSKYSHCEIVFSDGISASASRLDGGVRFKEIDYSNRDRWDVYEIIHPYGEEAEKAIRYYFSIHDGDTYDYLGAFGSWLRLDLTSEEKKFCSSICGIVLGQDPIKTPGRLFRDLKRYDTI